MNDPQRKRKRTSLRRRAAPTPLRRASVLIVVLIVVVLLSLGAYTFTQIMLSELEATVQYQRDVQARAYADSGIELVAAVLGEKTDEFSRTNLYDNPALFHVLMQDDESARRRGSFTIVAPRENDGGANPVRFGLIDESARLNLNSLMTYDLEEQEQQDILMALPNMTIEIADAILDWLDDDQTPRQAGAEDEYYGTLNPPYQAKNGKVSSLEDLLRVRGVTTYYLFGEDANRNGLLDPNENDGDESLPYDNADGFLDRGLSQYLTVISREANRRADGEFKIDVNQEDLVALYDAIELEFDDDTALFIVSYRMAGPSSTGNSSGGGSGGGGSRGGGSSGGSSGGGQSGGSGQGGGGQSGGQSGGTQSGGQTGNQSGATATAGNQTGGTPQAGSTQSGTTQSGGTQPGGNRSGGGSGGGTQSGGSSGGQTSGQSASQPSGANRGGGEGGTDSTKVRGGLDLSGGGSTEITSLYDLIGVEVEIEIDEVEKTLTSPWKEGANLQSDLPTVFDRLSTAADTFIEGRINISQASREVLLAVPELEAQVVEAILGAQSSGGSAAFDPGGPRATTGWLLTEGHVDLATMRSIDRYITSRGDVYRFQSVGYFDEGGPATRLEAVIDATQIPPAILSVRDLTDLGTGYPLQPQPEAELPPLE